MSCELLYNPDNEVTRNFMPHLWMFLLQALTPPGHEVLLVDGNAKPMDETQIAQFVRDQNIGLVGIGAMTRMVARAYRMADAIRATGVPVVMGGPHVTEEADEALGRDGGPRHADAVALGASNDPPSRLMKVKRTPRTPAPCSRAISASDKSSDAGTMARKRPSPLASASSVTAWSLPWTDGCTTTPRSMPSEAARPKKCSIGAVGGV